LKQKFDLQITLKNGWNLDSQTLTYYISKLNMLIESVDKCEEIKNSMETSNLDQKRLRTTKGLLDKS
jgi:hypothetical protein